MKSPADFQAVHVDVTPASALDKTMTAQLELLDENEIIELSIKPSLWFILIVSLRLIAFVAAATLLVWLTSPPENAYRSIYLFPSAFFICLIRIVIASLQWASRVYVLTNRRVMRLAGVVTVEVTDCPLRRVTGAQVDLGVLPRPLGLGTIRITPLDAEHKPVVWEHVARVGDIYARLIRSIKKSQSRP